MVEIENKENLRKFSIIIIINAKAVYTALFFIFSFLLNNWCWSSQYFKYDVGLCMNVNLHL